MRRVFFLFALFIVASVVADESRAALFRRSCSAGGCNVGSANCNVSSSQSCNISGAAAPASVIVQPQSPPVGQAPLSQTPLAHASLSAARAPAIASPPSDPAPLRFGVDRLEYDLASAARFCAAPEKSGSGNPAAGPALVSERVGASLALVRAFR